MATGSSACQQVVSDLCFLGASAARLLALRFWEPESRTVTLIDWGGVGQLATRLQETGDVLFPNWPEES